MIGIMGFLAESKVRSLPLHYYCITMLLHYYCMLLHYYCITTALLLHYYCIAWCAA